MPISPLQLALAALAGGAVGFLSGVFGVGGGFLIVPVLNIILGIPIEIAVGAGACQVLGPATTAILARRLRLRQMKLPLTMAGGLLLGVLAGAQLLEIAKAQGITIINGREVPLADLTVLIVYLVMLLAVGGFALWETRQNARGRDLRNDWLVRWKLPPRTLFEDVPDGDVSIPVVSWFGFAVGFLGGLLGVGGGFVLLPGLIYLLGMRTQRAVLVSLVIVWIVAFQSTIAHAWHGNVDLPLVMALLLGGTAGARFGSDLGVRWKGAELRKRFGWLVLGAAAMVAARLLSLFA